MVCGPLGSLAPFQGTFRLRNNPRMMLRWDFPFLRIDSCAGVTKGDSKTRGKSRLCRVSSPSRTLCRLWCRANLTAESPWLWRAGRVVIVCDKTGRIDRSLLSHAETWQWTWGKASVQFLELQTKWPPPPPLEQHLSSKSDWQASEWVFGRHSLNNEQNEPIASRTSADRPKTSSGTLEIF